MNTSNQFKHVWSTYLDGILQLGETRMAGISSLRKQSVGVALGVMSLADKKSVRNKEIRTETHLRWLRCSASPLMPAAVPMPFEDADFVNAISEKGAQQDEQSFHCFAPTNHDVTVKADGNVYKCYAT